jgi:hypothetical protein
MLVMDKEAVHVGATGLRALLPDELRVNLSRVRRKRKRDQGKHQSDPNFNPGEILPLNFLPELLAVVR